MRRDNTIAIRLINRMLDGAVFAVAFALGCATRIHFDLFDSSFEQKFTVESITMFFLIFFFVHYLSFALNKFYGVSRHGSFADRLAVCFRSTLMAFAMMVLISYLGYTLTTSRLLLMSSSAYVLILMIFKEFVMRRLIRYLYVTGNFSNRVVVVGQEEHGLQLFIDEIKENHLLGFFLVGVVLLDRKPKENFSSPVLGTVDDLTTICEDQSIDTVLFLTDHFSFPETKKKTTIERELWKCEERGIDIMMQLDLLDRPIYKTSVATVGGVPFLQFWSGPHDPGAIMFKYVLDRIFSFFGLLVLAPVFALIAIGIKLTSPGPVIFKQHRVGFNGRRFVFLKFRTMVTDAEQRRDGLQRKNEMQGPVFKVTNDPRVTPFGKFLRKHSLDELPQLINVLKGEMSLVGPRPPLPSEVKLYQGWQRRRLSMKPGITCIWQVSGRNNITRFGEWAALDLQYIDNWSIWLDIIILFKTIPAVLFGRGAS